MSRELAEPGLDRVVRIAAAALGVPGVLYSVMDGTRQLVQSAVIQGRPAPLRQIPLEHSLCVGVVRDGVAIRIPDVREVPACDHNPLIAALGIVGYLGTPVVVDGVVLGVLAAYSYERRPWSPEDVALIVDLALVAANEVELGRLRRVARPPPSVRAPAAAADGDAVVYDRRRFRVEAQERMVAARRAGTGLTLHLVRVEGVAAMRERLGTEAAERVLMDVVAVIGRSSVAGDVLGRITSEVYAVLGADPAAAARLAGRLQLGIAELNAEADRPWQVIARCGVAPWDPARPVDLDQLLLRAESAARPRGPGPL